MFFKKKAKNTPYFIFNYGCGDTKKCISLSAENGFLSGEWYDENDNHYLYTDIPMTEGFWDTLYTTAKEQGILEWKAYKLFNRFASEINLEVFNSEGLFPDGQSFEANNMHGLPENFKEASTALIEVFYSFMETG